MTNVILREVAGSAVERLRQAGVASPEADARTLLAWVAGIEPWQLATELTGDVDAERFQELVDARAAGWPLQYLTGVAYFRTIGVAVGPGVFIPRPETESVVGWALERLQADPATSLRFAQDDEVGVTQDDGVGVTQDDEVGVTQDDGVGVTQDDEVGITQDHNEKGFRHPARSRRIWPLAGGARATVVELCAGSGAISLAIAAEKPGCRQFAVELDDEAFRWLAMNCAGTSITPVHADMADALPDLDGAVDLVVVNPPYVPENDRPLVAPDVLAHEPEQALFAGPNGLDAIAVVARTAARLLRPGGLLVCEHDETHGATAPALLEATGHFDDIYDHLDLTQRPRFVTARRR